MSGLSTKIHHPSKFCQNGRVFTFVLKKANPIGKHTLTHLAVPFLPELRTSDGIVGGTTGGMGGG